MLLLFMCTCYTPCTLVCCCAKAGTSCTNGEVVRSCLSEVSNEKDINKSPSPSSPLFATLNPASRLFHTPHHRGATMWMRWNSPTSLYSLAQSSPTPHLHSNTPTANYTIAPWQNTTKYGRLSECAAQKQSQSRRDGWHWSRLT